MIHHGIHRIVNYLETLTSDNVIDLYQLSIGPPFEYNRDTSIVKMSTKHYINNPGLNLEVTSGRSQGFCLLQ